VKVVAEVWKAVGMAWLVGSCVAGNAESVVRNRDNSTRINQRSRRRDRRKDAGSQVTVQVPAVQL